MDKVQKPNISVKPRSFFNPMYDIYRLKIVPFSTASRTALRLNQPLIQLGPGTYVFKSQLK
jgi:hypothetical protein